MIGSTWKRLYYFVSSMLRLTSAIVLLICYVACRIVCSPDILWLNMLLFVVMLTCLATSLFNLVMCGLTATAYNNMFKTQIICFVVTMLTGGIVSTVFTGLATFVPVDGDELKREAIYNAKTFKFKEGKIDD